MRTDLSKFFSALVFATACSSSGDPAAPTGPTRIEVSPVALSFSSLGESAPLVVTAFNSAGAAVTGVAPSFSSGNGGIASVDNGGQVVAVGNGSTEITVSVSGISARVPVTVAQQPATLTIAPTLVSFVAAGDTARLVVVAHDARNNIVSGFTPTWTATSPSVATVTAAGLVTAVGDGETDIVARHGQLAAVTHVIVRRDIVQLTLPGDTIILQAIGDSTKPPVVALDARGSAVAASTVTWETTDLAVVTVSQSGNVVAVGNGVALVRARANNLVATRPVRVTQVASTLSFTTAPPTVIVEGETLGTMTVEARDRNGSLVRTPGAVIDLAIQAPPPNAGRLTGNLRAALANGIATFTGLGIDRTGPAYRILATSGPATASSTAIDVAIKFVSLGGSNDTFCGRDARSDTWCWGMNPNRDLAGGDTSFLAVPKRFAGANYYAIYTFDDGGKCGTNLGETTRCWGGKWGNVGAPAAPQAITTITVAGSEKHHCGLTGGGVAWCWGPNVPGSRGLGSATIPHPDSSTLVTGFHLYTKLIHIGYSNCGLRNDAALLCWGQNQLGQLGIPNGALDYVNSPTPVALAGVQFRDISMNSSTYTCAVTTTFRLFCWGSNADGKFGVPAATQPFFQSPFEVTGFATFTRAVAGSQHACALSTFGFPHCWGNNAYGGLGIATASTIRTTADLVTNELSFTSLAAHRVTCGLTQRGLIYCWGDGINDDGSFFRNHPNQLPRGTMIRANTAVP